MSHVLDATLFGDVFVNPRRDHGSAGEHPALPRPGRIIKESGIVLLTRIAGLLLSAIAVKLVADSVRGFLAEG